MNRMKKMAKRTDVAGTDGATIAVQVKLRYEQPFLRRYGSVKALTTGASGGRAEPQNNHDCDNDPKTKKCSL
jgi:hypothetical protein